MTSCREFFSDLDESTTGFVKFGDNSRIQIKGKGEIEVNQRNGSTLRLYNVLFVPQLEAHILSLRRLDEEGYRMNMGEGKLTIFSGELYLLKDFLPSTLELIHTNICGPISPATLGGSRYFLLIIDDFSRLTWVAMLQCKSDVFEAFKCFKNLVETEKGMKIKTLRSDRGGEFTSNEFSKYCLEHGIKRQLTAPYSPQ